MKYDAVEASARAYGFIPFKREELRLAQEHTGETVEPKTIKNLNPVLMGLVSGFGNYPVVDSSVGVGGESGQ